MNDPLNLWQPEGTDTESVNTQEMPVGLRHPNDQQAVKDRGKTDAIRIRREHKKHDRPRRDKTVVKDTDKAKWPSGVSALLPCASLCFALICLALLCFALLCFVLLGFALLCYAMLCVALLCCTLLRCVVVCLSLCERCVHIASLLKS